MEEPEPAYESDPPKSIEQQHSIDIRRMNGGKPVLEPNANNSWESKVVLNPGIVLVKDMALLETIMEEWNIAPEQKDKIRTSRGAAIMLYRAQGAFEPGKQVTPSYMGLAVFTPDLELIWRCREPVIAPDESFHHLGVEDGRCTFIDGVCYFLYTGYYYDENQDRKRVQICLATTRDFVNWDLKGPIAGDLNDVDNKNATLFPEKIHDQWVMLHRPMVGKHPKAIHWAVANRIDGRWESQGLLMASYRYREFRQSWIGAGGPPVALGNNRFLTIYHQGHFFRDHTREYDLAATILEFPEPGVCQVLKRIEPLMRPTGAKEKQGNKQLGVDNVLFSCANYILGDDLVIPYAGADSRIFGAKINMTELVKEIEN